MTVRMIFETSSEEFVKGVANDISRLRCWHAGFEAAGGKSPAHIDALWRAHQLLGSAKYHCDVPVAADDDEDEQ